MSRRHLTFDCAGETLAATLDEGSEKVGLLIVSGGNETRAGAFSGQSKLSGALVSADYPVLRFDRRGVGDSSGENEGYRNSGLDIAAALAAFREEVPHIERIVAFGNCDAATALALFYAQACDGLVLANPWTFDADNDDALPPASAIRARYLGKLKDPREWLRLLRGGINLGGVVRGLKKASSGGDGPSSLTQEIAEGLAKFDGDIKILLAGRDRTAQAFASQWSNYDPRVSLFEDADHSFSSPMARIWLTDHILAALHEQAR